MKLREKILIIQKDFKKKTTKKNKD
jgi:hypothetical protein